MFHENLIWFKHASFLYNGSKKIYVDPWEIREDFGKADIVCITHAHFDHFSPETITRLSTEETVVIVPSDVIQNLSLKNTRVLKPGKSIEIEDVTIQGIHAYNVEKPFHPKTNNWLGYLISLDGNILYHAGDTDRIEEMKHIKTDIALLPVGGTYTMNVEEAVRAANDIDLKLAIPMHYGYIVGSEQNGKDFARSFGEKAEVLTPKIPFEK